MHLGPERLRAIIGDALAAGTFVVCHDTLTYGDFPDYGPAICRGFFDAYETVTRADPAAGLPAPRRGAPAGSCLPGQLTWLAAAASSDLAGQALGRAAVPAARTGRPPLQELRSACPAVTRGSGRTRKPPRHQRPRGRGPARHARLPPAGLPSLPPGGRARQAGRPRVKPRPQPYLAPGRLSAKIHARAFGGTPFIRCPEASPTSSAAGKPAPELAAVNSAARSG